MNPEILNQLKDIHEPMPPSSWPLAIGYYIVFAVIAMVVGMVLYFFLGKKSRRLKKTVLLELSDIESAFVNDADTARLQASVAALLRRMVFTKQKDVSRAIELCQIEHALFRVFTNRDKTKTIIELIEKDRYRSMPDIDGSVLLNLVREQIKQCRI